MKKIKKALNVSLVYIRKNWFIFFAIFIYVFFTFYYMGPSMTSCTTTVYGFGDNTAGPIWKASLPESQGLIGSYTSMTNAPFGDNLNSPIGYSLVGQTVLIEALQNIAGPVCGYNIANMTGFILSAMVMFGFIYSITKKRWISLLAGYAVSFAPYYQLKIGAHFSFGFQAIFIGIIWLFYRIIKYKKKRDSIFLGLLFALAVYWDPYYTLLATLVIIPLCLVWVTINRIIFKPKFWRQKVDGLDIKVQAKLISTAAIISIILMIPLIYVFLTQGKQISTDVSNSRGNVLLEAQYCSNWPHEYIVPFAYNPIFSKIIGPERYQAAVSGLRDHYSCGIGEDIVGLSIALFLILFFGFIVMLWDKINKRKLKLNKCVHYETKILIFGLGAIALAAIIFSFPPYLFHNIIPTPSYLLLKLTLTWRTLTRIYVVTNIAFISLVAICMAYFYDYFKLKKHKMLSIIMFIIIFGTVIVEYQTSTPFTGNRFGTFSYKTSVPTQYEWLKDQKNINIIAEYPLERSGGEGNSMAYYLSMQVVHKKKLFNGSVSYGSQEILKTALKNLTDPQTIPVLKGMGVDAIVVHGVTKEELKKIPDIDIVYSSETNGFSLVGFSPIVSNDIVNIISLKNVKAQQSLIYLESGFYRNMTLINSVTDWQYLASNKSVMKIGTLEGNSLAISKDVCFDIKSFILGDASTLYAKVDGVTEPGVSIGDSFKTVKYNVKNSITLNSTSDKGMVITEVGCK